MSPEASIKPERIITSYRALIKKRIDGEIKYLLFQRAGGDTSRAGMFEFLGGESQPDEDVAQTLRREASEEGELDIFPDISPLYGYSERSFKYPRAVYTVFVYFANLATLKGEKVFLGPEHQKYDWFTREEIAQMPEHMVKPEVLPAIDVYQKIETLRAA